MMMVMTHEAADGASQCAVHRRRVARGSRVVCLELSRRRRVVSRRVRWWEVALMGENEADKNKG